MQDDGNLVMYLEYTPETTWGTYWSSDTAAGYKVQYHLYLNKTGLLQIWNKRNDLNPIQTLNFYYYEEDQLNSGDKTIYRATLGFDGVFRLYAYNVMNRNNSIMDSWPKDSTCDIMGFCGHNSFCTFNDDKPDNKTVRKCIPGHKFIDTNDVTLGCERNYI
ncbi:hypothetical protein RYX36_026837 [Vicia faba]